MAHTSSPKPTSDKKAACILYGFCEGPRLAGNMLKALDYAGYRITHDPYEADIVIAHSGGCFLVPHDLPARQVIMIGLTHWPGKSIVRALIEKNWDDFRFHASSRNIRAWLHKFSWNLVYFWNMPRNLQMLRDRKRGDFWQAKRVTLVRNKEDTFCTPDIKSLPFAHPPKFIELPDQHDDIWLHPERYTAIIKK
jgi:hypothetical protein